MAVLNTEKLQRQLARLAEETDRTAKSGLARLAFEAKEQVEQDLSTALDYSGPGTQRFIAGSYRLTYRTVQGVFSATLYPFRKAGELLARHVERTRVVPTDKADLLKDGRIVVPLTNGPAQRGRSGQVPKAMQPERLLERDARGRNRGFIAGGALFVRRGSGDAQAAFALESSTENPKRIDPQASARAAVMRRAGTAFGDAIGRAIRRATGA